MQKLGLFKKIAYLSLTTVSFSAFSWWDQPHQLIGLIASQNITPETYESAKKLLNVTISSPGNAQLSNNTNDFDTVSSWADAINMHSNTSSFSPKLCHYTDLLMDSSLIGTDISYMNAEKALKSALAENPTNSVVCLKSAIKTLMLSSPTQHQKAIALRFLMHIVQDMAQPLHNISKVENGKEDRGGNNTYFPTTIWIPTTSGSSSSQTKLHGVWDGTLGSFLQFHFKPSEQKLGIFSKENRTLNLHFSKKFQEDYNFAAFYETSANETQSIENWVIDSYQIAAKYVYSGMEQDWGTYSVNRYDIVNSQLLKGSVRLTHLLNAIFDPQNASLEFQKIVYDIKNDRKIKPFEL